MPDGKKYKVRVRIIEGSEGNHLQLGGWGWGWKWRAFPLLPPQKSLLVWVKPLLAIFVLYSTTL